MKTILGTIFLMVCSLMVYGAFETHEHDYGLIQTWKRERIIPMVATDVKSDIISFKISDKYETFMLTTKIDKNTNLSSPVKVGQYGMVIYCESDNTLLSFIRDGD